MMKSMVQFFGNAVLNLFYPPRCFSCCESLLDDSLEEKNDFCKNCINHLELASYEDRCSSCFEFTNKHHCTLKNKPLIVFGCFEKKSPIKGLLDLFKFQKNRKFAVSLAAFIVLQLDNLKIREPDLVSFIPLTWQEKLFKDCLDKNVAKEVAFFLKIPFKKILKASFVMHEPDWSKKEILFQMNSPDLMNKKTVLLISLSKRSKSEWLLILKAFASSNVKKVYLAQFLV